MVKTAQWLTLGLTAAMLSVMVGCTTSTPSNNQAASEQSATEEQTASQPESDQSSDQAASESKNPSRVVENVTLEPGTDPMTMVFSARQPLEEPTGSEQIKLNYPSPDKAVVVVTKTGLSDDSIAATRTRYEFVPVDASTEGAKQWQLAQVTEQNKCQANRGSQDWTGDLCL